MGRQGAQETSPQADALLGARIRGVGMQTAGLLEELRLLAGPVSGRPPAPRRIDPAYPFHTFSCAADRRALLNRFLRRRYRELLGRIPVLKYLYVPNKSAVGANSYSSGNYGVSLDLAAISPHIQYETAHSQELDAVDLAWYKRGVSP